LPQYFFKVSLLFAGEGRLTQKGHFKVLHLGRLRSY